MKAEASLHREIAQESLELAGYRFDALPPGRHSPQWTVYVFHGSIRRAESFTRPQRHDALAQALQFATMHFAETRLKETHAAAE